MTYKLKFCQTILIYLENDLPKSFHPCLLGNVFPQFLDNDCLLLLRPNTSMQFFFFFFFFFLQDLWLAFIMIGV